jgi:hypothetical protein
MSYKSQVQERFFHTGTAKQKGISGAVVAEFDKASKGMPLPKKAPTAKSALNKAMSKVGSTGY